MAIDGPKTRDGTATRINATFKDTGNLHQYHLPEPNHIYRELDIFHIVDQRYLTVHRKHTEPEGSIVRGEISQHRLF